jgi:hypothetical protein
MYYLTSCTISVLSRAQGIFLNEIAGNFQSEPEMIYCRTLIFLLQYKILYHMSFISKLHIYTVVINILATYIINMHQKCFEYFYICIPCHVVPRVICHDLHASLCKQTILNRDSSLFSNCAISGLSFLRKIDCGILYTIGRIRRAVVDHVLSIFVHKALPDQQTATLHLEKLSV